MSAHDYKLGLIARIIAWSARAPVLVIGAVVAATAWGWVSLHKAPLDAIPDLSDVQVIVFTEWLGQSPDLVEDQVTYPISTALLSTPKVSYVRGISMFGMSFVNVIFEDGTDMYWARTRVLESLGGVGARLPKGATPTLGPDATGVGGCSSTRYSTKPVSTTCRSCVRSRTGTFATRCAACPAWLRWRASAAS
jgi:Cu(I)/Ag(I) efflux system membrane protein CusA/SilA